MVSFRENIILEININNSYQFVKLHFPTYDIFACVDVNMSKKHCFQIMSL